MNKTLKSLISLLAMATMLLSIAPAGMAASDVKTPLEATISVFRNGEVKTEESTAILTDDVYYVVYDTGDRLGAVLYDEAEDGTKVDNTGKVITFNAENSGIMWEFSEATEVKRIDLWMLNCGGIDKYDVQVSNDGSDWKDIVTDATLATYTGTNSGDPGETTLASYYPVVLSASVTTKFIRINIDSFVTTTAGTSTAYISEARIYNHNNINFGLVNMFNDNSYRLLSPYMYNVSASTPKVKSNKAYYSGKYDGSIWPSYAADLKPYTVATGETQGVTGETDAVGRMWWASTFNRSEVKINRIKPNVTSGTITGIKIWLPAANDGASKVGNTNYPTAMPMNISKSNWQTKCAAEIKCDITKDTPAEECTFDIPNAEAASAFLIEFEYDANADAPGVRYVDLYSVGEYELNPKVYSQGISGTVGGGQTLTFNFTTNNNPSANAKVLFALYSGEELKSVSPVTCKIEKGQTVYSATYMIPANAGDNLTVKAFVWDGTTLKPLLDTPATTDAE